MPSLIDGHPCEGTVPYQMAIHIVAWWVPQNREGSMLENTGCLRTLSISRDLTFHAQALSSSLGWPEATRLFCL